LEQNDHDEKDDCPKDQVLEKGIQGLNSLMKLAI
jgi:hypothetical protein